jgi:glycosyltransferase involved in cell wall biosynthesis
MNTQFFFISIDGLTDPLGQSQVIPYLTGLAKKGFTITIVSCEKDGNFVRNKETVAALLKTANIKWKYCFYNSKIPLLSQWLNYRRLKQFAANEVKYLKDDCVIHCRSYLPALIGLSLKRKYGAKFIFDMRGFWANERVDGNIWKLSNPIHKRLFNYFKKKEKILINEADYIVTLAETGKQIVSEWMDDKTKPVQVIPCCADVNHFTILSAEEKLNAREKTGISKDAFILGYLGSIGTWYMLDEMLDFFIELKKKKDNAVLFFVTQDNKNKIIEAAARKNIDKSSIIIKPGQRNEVPHLVSTFDAGLFFIKPLFSKQGSSPTKMAEILACGIPVITNTGVGDCDKIINETNCGLLVSGFTIENYNSTLASLDNELKKSPEVYRKVAVDKFSLEDGVSRYEKIYNYLLSETK